MELRDWWLRMPSSSSHALIGGLVGAGLAKGGIDAIKLSSVQKAGVGQLRNKLDAATADVYRRTLRVSLDFGERGVQTPETCPLVCAIALLDLIDGYKTGRNTPPPWLLTTVLVAVTAAVNRTILSAMA